MPLGIGVGISSSLLSQDVSTAAPVDPILEDISVSFAAATVKLRAAYAGQCVRLRRASDNAESDFGFTALNVLDISAISTWLGGSNGFLVTWYDQSGNGNNATQSTAGNQPQYRASGIGTSNYPDFSYNGTSHYLAVNSLAALVSGSDIPWTGITVCDTSVPGNFQNFLTFGQSTTSTRYHMMRTRPNVWNSGRRGTDAAIDVDAGVVDTDAHTFSLSFAGTTVRLWVDNSNIAGPTAQNNNAMIVNRGAIGAAVRSTIGSYLTGHISVMIVLGGSELSDADRTTIDGNAVSVYGI